MLGGGIKKEKMEWAVVGVLAFNSNYPSSNPAEVYSFIL